MKFSRTIGVLYSTVFTCFIPLILGSGVAHAAPEGGLVVGGSAVIERSGATTTIRQSTNRGIIRWNSFDVGASERVDFQQPSRNSITVNRIVDTKASQIDGRLSANGNIVLLNANGIHFGSGARVDVGGLVASTSDLEDDQAFMDGGALRLTRPGNPDAKILNAGRITVRDAGLAGFVAPHVENEGVIEARLGRVTLASGDASVIDFAGDGLIQIEVSDAVLKQQVLNKGLISADGGQVILTAATGRMMVENLISNEGVIAARTTPEARGEIRITNPRGSIQNTGLIDAGGDQVLDGGRIDIDGSFVSLGGEINADGANGGEISISAGTLSLADRISAKGLAGDGGWIDILSQTSWEVSSSMIDASGFMNGGDIRHIAENQIISSGAYLTDGSHGMGGRIDISGWSTKFLGARMDANGYLGGGIIRLGGEYQGGKNLPLDELPNAYYLVMDRGTRIRAEATGENGRGGTTILWSDQETVALGSIFVKPGTVSGEGGFIEISSAQTPKFDATIESGRDERNGTVLLDPKNILISDFSFNSTAIILGYGYQGGRTSSNTNLDAVDSFGFATALDGNRMAVGAWQDDGFNNTGTNTGAVYLFSFTDSAFSGAVLEGIIGTGYTGGKNFDVTLSNSDGFGYSVSLDGNRLAVGAYLGDGSVNAITDSGEVYLFSFADSVFSGATLEAMVGRNYTGGKNINVSALAASDNFGASVALDGNRLAVGAFNGDGSTNALSGSGEVYVFSFTDSAFSGGVFEATIGSGYTGGKNINVVLEVNDNFGVSLDLDGTQLVVGAERDDGFGNALTDSGAVYLFSFADSVFSTGVHQGTMGFGYTGGKNVNITDLGANDYFGSSVAIDNNRLAVGAYFDDGYLDVGSVNGNFGAVRLYTISNSTFDSLTMQSMIGFQYRDLSKNFDLFGLNLAGSDYFGKSLSLDGNRLIVGAYGDDGLTNNSSQAGALYAFTFADSSFSTANLEGITGSGYVQGRNYNVPTLSDTDNTVGLAVSVDGTKLAIGNYLDDGFGDIRQSSGAVYLYSFSDDSFTDGILQAIVGAGYTGGKNYRGWPR